MLKLSNLTLEKRVDLLHHNPMMMTNHIVDLASTFSKHLGIEVSALSRRLFKDSKKIQQLSNGHDLYTARYQAALAYFDTNWPSDLEWPSDIPRPSVAEREDASAA
nr:hypothetical protein [uncultured Cohaesibacter sp.]